MENSALFVKIEYDDSRKIMDQGGDIPCLRNVRWNNNRITRDLAEQDLGL